MNRPNKIAFFLIFATIVFTALAYGTVHSSTLALFYVLAAVMTLLWAADCLLSGAFRFSRTSLQLPLLAFGLYGLIQVIPFGHFSESPGVADIPRTISLEPFATQVTSVHVLILCLFFAISLVYLDSAKRLRRAVTVLLIFGFAFAFFAVLQAVLSPNKIYGIYGTDLTRPFGSFVNHDDFAAYVEMLLGIPLGLMFVGAVPHDKKLLYIIAIALMGTSLLLSGSRGGLIALLAEIVLLIIITTSSRGWKNLLIKVALAGLLVGATVAGAVFVGGETSLTRLADSSAEAEAGTSRLHIWSVTAKVIKENLPFGTGLGAYPQGYTRLDSLSGLERVEQAHNDYLQVLADAGVVGLVIGAVFLFLFFRTGLHNTKASNTFRKGVAAGAFAGCFAILTHSVFDFVLHITAISVMFLTLLALLVASGRKYADDITDFDEYGSHRAPFGKRDAHRRRASPKGKQSMKVG